MHISDTYGPGAARTTRRTLIRAAFAAPLGAAVVTSAQLATAGAARAATGDRALTAGLNADGQLGNGTLTNRPSFATLAPPPGTSAPFIDLDEVAGGRQHAL